MGGAPTLGHGFHRNIFLISGALGMNVLMFGFDSMSRMTYIRNLPDTYTYLTQELGAVVLEGYNIVGKCLLGNNSILYIP